MLLLAGVLLPKEPSEDGRGSFSGRFDNLALKMIRAKILGFDIHVQQLPLLPECRASVLQENPLFRGELVRRSQMSLR